MLLLFSTQGKGLYDRQKCILASKPVWTGSNFMLRLGICLFSWSFPPVPHTGPMFCELKGTCQSSCFRWPAPEGILQSAPVLLFTGYRNDFSSHEVYSNFRDWAVSVSVQYFNPMTHWAIISHRNPWMQETDRNLFLLTACLQRITY